MVTDDDIVPRGLRTMRRNATLLLVAMAAVFIVARALEQDDDAWGYVRATAEAAMVGGIADWFAVTALFRYPMGLRIPHTAIVPTRKDEIGRSLGVFVESNFLDDEVVTARIREAEVPARVGEWLGDDANCAMLADRAMAALVAASELLDDEAINHAIERAVRERIIAIPAAPLLGNLIDTTMDGGHHVVLVDAMFAGADRFIDDNQMQLRERLHEESPWFVPMLVDDRVFRRIVTGVKEFIDEVGSNPQHPIRRHLDDRTRLFAVQLRTDPALAARGDELMERVLDHPEVRAWTASIWHDAKASLATAAGDRRSAIHQHVATSISHLGATLRTDPQAAAKLEEWTLSAVRYLASEHGHQVASLISTTVERWDAGDTSRRIENAVGRDLQYIRINGTIVGGLAGLVIHAVSETLFG